MFRASQIKTLNRCLSFSVDKNASVSSAALVSSLHLSSSAGEVIKRWANEAQEALNSDNIMVQYHALGLLYYIRRVDRLAVTKLINKLSRQNLKSPYAVCFLVSFGRLFRTFSLERSNAFHLWKLCGSSFLSAYFNTIYFAV